MFLRDEAGIISELVAFQNPFQFRRPPWLGAIMRSLPRGTPSCQNFQFGGWILYYSAFSNLSQYPNVCNPQFLASFSNLSHTIVDFPHSPYYTLRCLTDSYMWKGAFAILVMFFYISLPSWWPCWWSPWILSPYRPPPPLPIVVTRVSNELGLEFIN